MQIIPVVDLKNGDAVRAVGGDRSAYLPLRSPLTASSAPDAVVAALISRGPISCIYVADLDAIEGRGHHQKVVSSLLRRHPAIDFWVDAGLRNPDDLDRFRGYGAATPVIGSESLQEPEVMDRTTGDPVLSLDFKGDELLGPVPLMSLPQCWPPRVIVMCLAQVGSGAGPDLERIAAVRARNPNVSIYAAGGIRNGRDIEILEKTGCSGALVGSAIHAGMILA